MKAHILWTIFGIVLTLLELIIPGGIIVFVGLSAVVVGAALHFGLIDTVVHAFLAWFICSIFSMLILRSFFMKFFEGDSKVYNVDEEADLIGSFVIVSEEMSSQKVGRVKFRDTSWPAKSSEQLLKGQEAVVEKREGNCLLVKSINNN